MNNTLEVTWNNGQLVLDSKNTNFSYGSLQRVMRIGLAHIDNNTIKRAKKVLVLGVAGGSVLKILYDEFEFTGKITGIELDKNAIQIANKYFGLNKIKNTEIINVDAQNFVMSTQDTFDLIIIDIFQDNIMPDFLFEEPFIKNSYKILNQKGTILFNTIVNFSNDIERNGNYKKIVEKHFQSMQILSNIEGNNELFLLGK